MTTSRVDFVVKKTKCWTHIIQCIACFLQPYLVVAIWLQDISKTWNHSIISIKIGRGILHAAEGGAKGIIWGISWKSLSTTFVFWEYVIKEWNNDLVLASLKTAHILTQRKRPYTELEFVVLPGVEITADLCTEEKAVDRVRQIPLSGKATKCRCLYISEDMLKHLLHKRQNPQSFRIHPDVITDVSDEVQLVVYCRVADEEKNNSRVLLVLSKSSWTLRNCSSLFRWIPTVDWGTWFGLDEM